MIYLPVVGGAVAHSESKVSHLKCKIMKYVDTWLLITMLNILLLFHVSSPDLRSHYLTFIQGLPCTALLQAGSSWCEISVNIASPPPPPHTRNRRVNNHRLLSL